MRRIAIGVLLVALSAGSALAQTIEEQIITTLEAQGYTVLERGRTFLGRLRVVVENDTLRREIVFNPGTGEILRDYSVLLVTLRATQPDDDPKRTSDPVVAVTTPADAAATGTAPPVGFDGMPDRLELPALIPDPILP